MGLVEGVPSLGEKVQHVVVRILTAIVATFGLIYGYLCVFDREPPIKDVSISLVEYNAAEHYMIVDWSAFKNRRCDGERSQAISEVGAEPPPRLLIPLETVKLPPADFNGTPQPSGQVAHWRRMVMLPDNIPHPFVYSAEWAFHCNPAQGDLRSIYVKSPSLIVE